MRRLDVARNIETEASAIRPSEVPITRRMASGLVRREERPQSAQDCEGLCLVWCHAELAVGRAVDPPESERRHVASNAAGARPGSIDGLAAGQAIAGNRSPISRHRAQRVRTQALHHLGHREAVLGEPLEQLEAPGSCVLDRVVQTGFGVLLDGRHELQPTRPTVGPSDIVRERPECECCQVFCCRIDQ